MIRAEFEPFNNYTMSDCAKVTFEVKVGRLIINEYDAEGNLVQHIDHPVEFAVVELIDCGYWNESYYDLNPVAQTAFNCEVEVHEWVCENGRHMVTVRARSD